MRKEDVVRKLETVTVEVVLEVDCRMEEQKHWVRGRIGSAVGRGVCLRRRWVLRLSRWMMRTPINCRFVRSEIGSRCHWRVRYSDLGVKREGHRYLCGVGSCWRLAYGRLGGLEGMRFRRDLGRRSLVWRGNGRIVFWCFSFLCFAVPFLAINGDAH